MSYFNVLIHVQFADQYFTRRFIPSWSALFLVQLTRSNAFCQSINPAHNSSSMSKFHFNIILSIPPPQWGTKITQLTCSVTGHTPTLSPSFNCLRPFSGQAFFSPMNTITILKHSHSTPIRLWRWNRQSVPKRPFNSDAGEVPRRKHTTFRTRQKFEISQINK